MINNFGKCPKYPDDHDYTTNAPSYYDDLARKSKLIQLLSERIWEYENTLNETLEQIEKRLTDYITENDSLMNERLENWDKRIEEMPEEMRSLFVKWLNDGTLEQIINHDVLGNKADQSDLDETNAQLGYYGKVLGNTLPDETDDTGRVQRLIDSLGSGEHGLIPPKVDGSAYRFTGVQLKSNIHLTIRGNFVLTGEGNTAFSLAGCLYTILDGEFHVGLIERNQIGFYIGQDENGKNAELNTLINASVEGEYIEGTTSLVLDRTWVNRFYNCHWFRSENGVMVKGLANANNFFGCEVRADRGLLTSGVAIEFDGGGGSNVWYGGAVENHFGGIVVKRGQLSFIGTWIEGIGQPTNRGIRLEGGSLTIKDGYVQAYAEIAGGQQFVFEGNTIASNYDSSVLNINFPLIQYSVDVSTKLLTSGNILPDGAYLTRYGKYQSDTGTPYTDRSSNHLNETSEEMNSHVITQSTGMTSAPHAEEFVVNFSNTHIDTMDEWNGSTFIPKNDGYYKATVTLSLTGVPGGAGFARVRYNNEGVKTQMTRVSTNTRDFDGKLTIEKTSVIKVNANQPLNFNLFTQFSDSDKDYDILTGTVIIDRYM